MMDKIQNPRARMSEIEVVRYAKGSIRLGKVPIGNKDFELLGYLPFLKSRTDYNLLMEGDYEKRKITGAVLPIWMIRSPIITNLRASTAIELKQATISREKNKRQEFLMSATIFESTKPLVGEPMSEYYYYNFKKDELRKCKEGIHEIIYKTFLSGDEKEKPDMEKYYNRWQDIVNQGHMLSVQTHNLEYQRAGKMDIVLPTNVIIRQEHPEALDIALEANKAAELATEMKGVPKEAVADYYLIHYNVFENKAFAAKVIDALIDRHFNRTGKKFIFIKITNEAVMEQFTYRINFYELLAALDTIRNNTEDTVIVLLNAGALGLACMGKIDAYSEPMDGQTIDKGGWPIKRLDNMKGRWYDPKTRIFWKFSKVQEYWQTRNALPAEGKYGRAIGGIDPSTQTDHIWNMSIRRKHLLEERSIELVLLEEEAKKNGVSAAVWLKQRLIDSETPNLAKLL